MNTPYEIIHIPLDDDTIAVLRVHIINAPAFPTPNERETVTVPTGRQIDLIGRLLKERRHVFP
jgi:hypothetical protein